MINIACTEFTDASWRKTVNSFWTENRFSVVPPRHHWFLMQMTMAWPRDSQPTLSIIYLQYKLWQDLYQKLRDNISDDKGWQAMTRDDRRLCVCVNLCESVWVTFLHVFLPWVPHTMEGGNEAEASEASCDLNRHSFHLWYSHLDTPWQAHRNSTIFNEVHTSSLGCVWK